MAYRTMEMTLISAKDLKGVNLISRMDVYAVASIAGDPRSRQRTPTDIDGGKNPTWNRTFTFTVPDQDPGRIVFHVILRSERALGDRDVGEVHVPLRELLDVSAAPGDEKKTAPAAQFVSYQVLTPHSGKAKGVLHISYKFSNLVTVTAPPVTHKAGPYGAYSPPPYMTVDPANFYAPPAPHNADAYPTPAPYDAHAYSPPAPHNTDAYPTPAPNKCDDPVTAYPPQASPKSNEHITSHPPPGGYSPHYAPPPHNGYSYGPPPPHAGYGGYSPYPPCGGYGGYPPPTQGGYGYGGYPPQQGGYGYGHAATQQVLKPPAKKNKSRMGMGMGMGLLGGAIGGMILGDMVSDAADGFGNMVSDATDFGGAVSDAADGFGDVLELEF